MTDQNLGTGIILCKIEDPNSFFIINMGISSLLMNMEPRGLVVACGAPSKILPSIFKYLTFDFFSTTLITCFIQNILKLLKKSSIYLKYII
jgi:hypothetical protein